MKVNVGKGSLKTMEIKPKKNPAVLTSMKVSMLSIRAWARPMMNWFTHAIAWDLRERHTQVGSIMVILKRNSQRGKGEEKRQSASRDRVRKQKVGVSLTWSWGCSAWKTVGIWGSWCWEVCSEHRYPITLMNPRRSSATLRMNPEKQRQS